MPLLHLLVAADSPRHSLACSCITPLSASIITWPPSLGVFTWPSYKEGSQPLELESTPSGYDLIELHLQRPSFQRKSPSEILGRHESRGVGQDSTQHKRTIIYKGMDRCSETPGDSAASKAMKGENYRHFLKARGRNVRQRRSPWTSHQGSPVANTLCS